jgi:hypothetical protein
MGFQRACEGRLERLPRSLLQRCAGDSNYNINIDQGEFVSFRCSENLHEHPTVGDSFEKSILVLVELRLPINLSFPEGIYVQDKPRTSSGIQYTDLSSLTLHVVQSELRKESNVVLKPIADTRDQIDF